MKSSRLQKLHSALPTRPRSTSAGQVKAAHGPLVRTFLPSASIGDLCIIQRDDGSELPAQVVAFDERGARLAPFDSVSGVSPGNAIVHTGAPVAVPFNPKDSERLRVVDCLGKALGEQQTQSAPSTYLSLMRNAPCPLRRGPINTQLFTGVHAIDLCTPIGYGQRIGLFAGPGVGKSTLLGMIANNAVVDRVVIGLIGERGREVGDFIRKHLPEDSRSKATVVVATSDESAVRRRSAGYTATAIAEYYRDRGERVLLLIDSLSRAARAIRDLSLSAGELPVRQGYTSSVFEELPRLVERAGTAASGSITAIYTVLTGFNDQLDILSEEIKSLLDGHIVLSHRLAERGLFPAIDVTRSISRLAGEVVTPEALEVARTLVLIRSRLQQDKSALLLGGKPDKELQACLEVEEELNELLYCRTLKMPESPPEGKHILAAECSQNRSDFDSENRAFSLAASIRQREDQEVTVEEIFTSAQKLARAFRTIPSS